MPGMDTTWMPAFDPVTGMLVLPLWMAAVVAALLVILLARNFLRMSVSPGVSVIPQYAAVALGLVLAWMLLDRLSTRDHADAARALEARFGALIAQATAPGSALACLEPVVDETVENACEKGLFASAETVASAVSHTGAKLALLGRVAETMPNPGATFALGTIIDSSRYLRSPRVATPARFGPASPPASWPSPAR